MRFQRSDGSAFVTCHGESAAFTWGALPNDTRRERKAKTFRLALVFPGLSLLSRRGVPRTKKFATVPARVGGRGPKHFRGIRFVGSELVTDACFRQAAASDNQLGDASDY